jgi:hypothetical protein
MQYYAHDSIDFVNNDFMYIYTHTHTHILRGNFCLILPIAQVRTIFIHSARSYSLRLTDGVDVPTVGHLQVALVFLQFDMYILSRSSHSLCLTYGVQ